MAHSEQQNLAQDRLLGVTLGENRVVERTWRDADGTINVLYQDGATLVQKEGKQPKLTAAE